MDFSAPYNRNTYLDFLRDKLLPEDFSLADEIIRPEFKPQFIQRVTKIGHSPSLELNVYEVEHNSENDPRVTLSKESFRLLADHGEKRALMLFTSKASNYRFSLVTVDLELEGKKVKREYSNPRRYSFFLGPDAKVHTPQQYLGKMVTDFEDLKKRFSIEVVTKEFYKEYANVFAEIENAIAKNNKLSKPDLRLYTQILMNRLMFLRFLEKKKWVKFGNSPDYLANLYAAGGLNKQSFFITRLCPLFFEALAIEGRQDSEAVGKTVFLNGGLFEKSKLDEKVQDIPDTAFKNLLGPDGLFYKFNFTVEESTPIDIEVSVDPEMLGKVFEELVTGRHETGSYYTPRPIVSFMCKEALKGYLSAKTSASKEAIALLADEHQIAPDLTNRHAEEILFYLETIKAVDPACGSGAYLLGLLQELIEIRKTLQNQQLKSDPDFIYKLKLQLISYCLYGVDIDPFATNIAKLRLWLSLSVEADSPQPLPNLDFKIETGDAILGPCDIFANRPNALAMSALRQKARQLVFKKDRYMLAHGGEKQKLYDEITAEEKALAEQTGTIVGENVIAWHIHFAEVFTSGRRTESTIDGRFGFMADAQKQKVFKMTSYEPGGFDIVLANPPYVNMVEMDSTDPDYRERLRQQFETARGGFDLFIPFMERGIDILNNSGIFVFITPNKLLGAEYASSFRNYFTKKMQLISLTDVSKVPVFNASVYPIITIGKKASNLKSDDNVDVFIYTGTSPDSVELHFVQKIPFAITSLTDNLWSPLLDIKTGQLLTVLKSPLKLEDIAEVSGAATVNEAYQWKEALIDDGAILFKNDPTRYKPFIVSGNIRRYFHTWSSDTVQYIKHTYHEPVIDIKHKSISERRITQIFKTKVVVSGMSKRPTCFYDDKGIAAGKTTIVVIPKRNTNGAYLAGVINSKAMDYTYHVLFGSLSLAGGYLRFGPPQLRVLPIPIATVSDQNKIADLVQKCFIAKGVNCEQLQNQIDRMVYELYGLTPDEIAIVEANN